jgi:hypothetical protein
MKKLFVLLLILPQFIFAQKQYAPLDATWRFELHTFDCTNHFLQYKVEKEIEIDGKDCSVIYAYTSYHLAPFQLVEDSLIVWENDQKVYFYQYDDFHLLYDFTIEEGDTLDYFLPSGKVYFSPYQSEENDTAVIATKLVVQEITEVDINGLLLKRFETNYPDINEGFYNYMGYVVENVGSTYAQITGTNQAFVSSGCGPNFYCYENEDFSYPPDFSCEYPTSTKNIYTEKEIILYPNPTFGELYIINHTPEAIEHIDVINWTGQRVVAPSTTPTNISLESLPKGIYLIDIIFISGNTHIQKIVKYE